MLTSFLTSYILFGCISSWLYFRYLRETIEGNAEYTFISSIHKKFGLDEDSTKSFIVGTLILMSFFWVIMIPKSITIVQLLFGKNK
jgi:ABC-type phosphate transport system permease subunit